MSKTSLFKSFLVLILISYLSLQGTEQSIPVDQIDQVTEMQEPVQVTDQVAPTIDQITVEIFKEPSQEIPGGQEDQVKEIKPMPELIKIFKECCGNAKLDFNFNRYGIGHFSELLLLALITATPIAGAIVYAISNRNNYNNSSLPILTICVVLSFILCPLNSFIHSLRLDSIRKGLEKEFQVKLSDFLKQSFEQQPSGISFETYNHKVDALLNWALASSLPEERRAKVFARRLEQIVKYPIFACSMIKALQKEVLANTHA